MEVNAASRRWYVAILYVISILPARPGIVKVSLPGVFGGGAVSSRKRVLLGFE